MNWALAIDRNRDALLRILAVLFAAAGLTPGGAVPALSRQVHNAVLRVLRPAESAARRLIVIAARDVSVTPAPVRACPKAIPRGSAPAVPSFSLLDPMKRFGAGAPPPPAGPGPRISVPGLADPAFPNLPPFSPEDFVDAGRLCRRMLSLQRALGDVPHQARRLARWHLRRGETPGAGRCGPLRPGWPPGHRARPIHEVDTILADCHGLARCALEAPDTS